MINQVTPEYSRRFRTGAPVNLAVAATLIVGGTADDVSFFRRKPAIIS